MTPVVYDVVVLGGGSAGTNVAWYARDNGLSCAVVEGGVVGGTCSYWACMPSKALLASPGALAAARAVPGAAEACRGGIDVAAVLARRDDVISHLDDTPQAEWLASIGADLVRGHGRLAGERRVEVATPAGDVRAIHAERGVVIATGSRAAIPPIAGLAECGAWDERAATTVTSIPRRFIVLGGGAVGCEMAQAYRRLGADEVTILETSDRVLHDFEPWVSTIVRDALEREGIGVLEGVEATAVTRAADRHAVTVELAERAAIVGDELLVAAGREFNTDAIGLESVGVEASGPIGVDDHLRAKEVAGGWLFAVGDVNGRALVTHQGKYQARCVADTLAGRDVEAMADRFAVPQVVFTDPEVAAVGRMHGTSADASEASSPVRQVTAEFDSVAGATLSGRTTGRGYLAIDDRRHVVVGATFVGAHASELLHTATVAIVGAVPVDRLWHAVPAFPTVSEIWLRLLEADRGL